MGDAPGSVRADDVPPRIDTLGGGGGGARDINAGEAALLVEQEAMSDAASGVLPNDVAPRVDPEGPCGGGARDVNGGKRALVKQEAMIDAPSLSLIHISEPT